jgi:hypothetical protein
MVDLSERGSHSPSNDDSIRSGCSFRHDTSTAAMNDKENERATLGSRETVVVTRMKSLVVIVLLATTILVSTGVFVYTRNEQLRSFEESFRVDASRLLESFHQSVKRTIEAVDALSLSITFPFLTLPFDLAMLASCLDRHTWSTSPWSLTKLDWALRRSP